ncbi:MAG: hypothetical protein LH619_03970 [Chitinophagaceae bacterium]|nr:hypothetical protein [Chitinophagaceae bacterium]
MKVNDWTLGKEEASRHCDFECNEAGSNLTSAWHSLALGLFLFLAL